MSKPPHRFAVSTPWRGPDRRSGRDRRREEAPPPNGRDRRIGLEPRMPEVVETEFSPSEWDALHQLRDPEG